MTNEVVIVSIGDAGIDMAVLLDDMVVLSADKAAGDSLEPIEHVASSLSAIHGVPVRRITHYLDEANADCWDWGDVIIELVDTGKISGLENEYTLSFKWIDEAGTIHQGSKDISAPDYDDAVRHLLYEFDENGRLLSIDDYDQELGGQALIYSGQRDEVDGKSEFTLTPYIGSSCWLTVGNLSVYVKQEGEGVVVDIYPLNDEASEPVSTTYAHFQDAVSEEVAS